MSFKEIVKAEKERANYKRYCDCGHSIVFPTNSKTNKTICSWCGHWIYKNDLEEFKERYQIKKKEIENENK